MSSFFQAAHADCPNRTSGALHEATQVTTTAYGPALAFYQSGAGLSQAFAQGAPMLCRTAGAKYKDRQTSLAQGEAENIRISNTQ